MRLQNQRFIVEWSGSDRGTNLVVGVVGLTHRSTENARVVVIEVRSNQSAIISKHVPIDTRIWSCTH